MSLTRRPSFEAVVGVGLMAAGVTLSAVTPGVDLALAMMAQAGAMPATAPQATVNPPFDMGVSRQRLAGIGAEQHQCWADWNDLSTWEKEVPLSELLLERRNGRCVPVRSRSDWEAKRQRIRESWMLLLGRFPDTVPSLNVRILKEEQKDGYILKKVVYQSEPDDEVSAYLLVPDGFQGRAPAIVACMPSSSEGKDSTVGLAKDEESGWWFALELARRGYVVLAPDVLTSGERISPGLAPFDTSAFYKRHPDWSMFGKMLWDYQRGIDYLLTLDFVDTQRIGAIGWSLGGHNACLLAAFDSRIAVAVSDGGVAHFAGSPNPFAFSREMSSQLEGKFGKFVYIPRLKLYLLAGEIPTDFHELQALIAPRPYLDMNSTGGTAADCWRAGLSASMKLRRLYTFLGAPEKFDYTVFDGGHGFPGPMRMRAYGFLDRYLKPEIGSTSQ